MDDLIEPIAEIAGIGIEAAADSRSTRGCLIWLALTLIVIAAFIGIAVAVSDDSTPEPPAVTQEER
ncbi:MAG: hypothetical protein Q7S02_03315 [bacterium]|nr:hypothetical protein [bacterium]